MRFATIIATTVLTTISAAAASAQCRPIMLPGDLLNRSVWLAQNEKLVLPTTISGYDGLRVPKRAQTGPDLWEPTDKTVPQGLRVRVKRVLVRSEYGSARTVEASSEQFGDFIVDSMNVMGFDFTKCTTTALLEPTPTEHGYESQWMRGLTARILDGAKPVDFGGRWIDQRFLADIVYVGCSSYETSAMRPRSVRCVPVWKNGVDPETSDLPRELFFTAPKLELKQIKGAGT